MSQHSFTTSPPGTLSRLLASTVAMVFCLAAQAEPAPPPLDLTGTGWNLVKVQSMDDSQFAPSANDTGDYSLRFVEAGRVAIGADCNRGQASLEPLTPPRLKFGPVAVTRAFCGPPSVADRYLDQLQWVRSYMTRDGHLYLATAADASILEFKPLDDDSVTARVLGFSLVTREPEALRETAVQILIDHYAQSHSLAANAEEIEQFLDQQDAQLTAEDEQQDTMTRSERLEHAAMRRHNAARAIQNWKVNAALYAGHGGRIAAGQQGPVPLDAQRALLQDAQGSGDFRVLDLSIVDAFWNYFDKPPQDTIVQAHSPQARDAFSSPPWAKKPAAP